MAVSVTVINVDEVTVTAVSSLLMFGAAETTEESANARRSEERSCCLANTIEFVKKAHEKS